jgi:hypothetical protein
MREGLVEHVIGFHDVLILRPMGAKPERPKNDPVRRWVLTHDALREVFARPVRRQRGARVPAMR